MTRGVAVIAQLAGVLAAALAAPAPPKHVVRCSVKERSERRRREGKGARETHWLGSERRRRKKKKKKKKERKKERKK